MQKLFGVFFVITLLIGVVGFIGMANSSNNNKTLNKIIENNIRPMSHALEAKSALSIHSRNIYRLIVTRNDREFISLINNSQYRIDFIKSKIYNYKDSPLTMEEKATISQLETAFDQYIMCSNKIIDLIFKKDQNSAWEIVRDEFMPLFLEVEDNLTELVKYNRTYIEEDRLRVNLDHEKSQGIMLFIVIISKIISVALGLFMTFSITNPINRFTKITEEIARGHIDIEKPNFKRKDELGTLSTAFCMMIDFVKHKEDLENQIIELNDALEKNIDEAIAKIREMENEKNTKSIDKI